MRRKDRALEREAALRILDQTEWMTLSMTQPDGTPYAVPVNMTRAGEWLYFHCAREGKKIDCLRACPQVCVTAVGHARVIPEQYTTEYESAVVFGTAEEVLEEAARWEGLRVFSQKFRPEPEEEFRAQNRGCFSQTALSRRNPAWLSGSVKQNFIPLLHIGTVCAKMGFTACVLD